MSQPECGCFVHLDLADFRGARCEHGEYGDFSDPTAVVVAMPFIHLVSDSES